MNAKLPNRPALVMPPDAWQEGYDSGSGDVCPYPPESRESWAWSAGKIEGQAAAGIVPTPRPERLAPE